MLFRSVRVGDRMSTFDLGGVYFLQEVARRGKIRVQRALMDGGSCEATAFGGLGYRACGMCLPLGNYHNVGPNWQIRREYVSVADLLAMAKLTFAAARAWLSSLSAEGTLRGEPLPHDCVVADGRC